jgi:hypothetical protein
MYACMYVCMYICMSARSTCPGPPGPWRVFDKGNQQDKHIMRVCNSTDLSIFLYVYVCTVYMYVCMYDNAYKKIQVLYNIVFMYFM